MIGRRGLRPAARRLPKTRLRPPDAATSSKNLPGRVKAVFFRVDVVFEVSRTATDGATDSIRAALQRAYVVVRGPGAGGFIDQRPDGIPYRDGKSRLDRHSRQHELPLHQ